MIARLILISTMLVSAAAQAEGFRGIDWGAPTDAIIAKEGEPLSTHGGNLIYKVSLANLDTAAIFAVDEKGLYQGLYVLSESHTNKNAYIDDYAKLKKLLTDKYGEPSVDKTAWANDLYRDRRSRWGMAVSAGHLKYLSEWESDRTRIQMMLNGDNFEVTHAIMYTDIRSEERIKERDKQEAQADL